MGQAPSTVQRAPRTHEELTRELASKFAEKCFTPLELYSLKDNFKSLADVEQNVRYLKEDTIARFLEIPDILHVSPVIFHMISYIGSFPFLQDAPAVLGLESMVMVITILTERYRRVLAKGSADRTKLLFKSLAVYDRKLSGTGEDKSHDAAQSASSELEGSGARLHAPGFAVDEPGDDEPDFQGEEYDDDMVLAALESLDYIDAFKQGNRESIHGAVIPADNFRKLVMLLLMIAPLEPQERLSNYSERVVGEELESLRSTAECVLAAFLNVEKSPGIKFESFETIIPVSFPYLFSGFNALFEHFLFSRNLDFSKHKGDNRPEPAVSREAAAPLLQDRAAILSANTLSQLSFFLPGTSLFRRLRLLYSGDNDGFSMGSFETHVFHWRAPTILLVRGTRVNDAAHGSHERFAATVPPKRFPDGSSNLSDRLTFGAYLGQAWRHSHKECFGDTDSVLFQLEPVHDVFPASTINRDYASYTKPSPSANNPGIAFGNPLPKQTASYRRESIISLGAVSLFLDSSFEFGVFTHDFHSKGGAFQTSAARRFNFQDRFEIESLEVWGCGGDEEARVQAERWAWEAREAEARRKVNLGTGDIEADRALLEMAGLIGGNRSGGSMT
ncbi:Restriction of telomere capping protein 5 [Pleurostoma richardsiae]|uniref:Restriction of telomere capping protein 5 n=1 Tax=Pleurostoma richardsiae TaxID=41990 RepID=A0AA38RL93_9PEZI|nr:Restriction of telomere capping protein 5 [Pleurostoma richardsiae]